jgi:two-component system nitrogen regulation sensor histidine kinase NtrY
VIDEALRSREDILPRDVSLTRGGRELHLAIMATPLRRQDGGSDGIVIVFDDVTPLVRTQKVAAWREVARRLAHEIKNPLTPIQLSAERLRRHLSSSPEPTKSLVDECTEHHRRRGRVAEGAGRRVLAIRAHACAAHCVHRPARIAR